MLGTSGQPMFYAYQQYDLSILPNKTKAQVIESWSIGFLESQASIYPVIRDNSACTDERKLVKNNGDSLNHTKFDAKTHLAQNFIWTVLALKPRTYFSNFIKICSDNKFQ